MGNSKNNQLNKKLMPIGFYDLIFAEAENNHRQVNNILEYFMGQGYRLIKPSLVEFADQYLQDNKNSKSENLLYFTDLFSGENMVFRNDITSQIARILNSSLASYNLPLKLCYSGDVIASKSDELYAHRQQTQLGLEIIHYTQNYSEIEVIEKTLFAVNDILLPPLSNENIIPKILIEFSLPKFLEKLLNEFNVELLPSLIQAIFDKNISNTKNLLSQIENLDISKQELLIEIMLNNHNLGNIIGKIMTCNVSDAIISMIDKINKIYQFINHQFPKIEVCFDLFGNKKSNDYQGLFFEVFVGNFSYPIARGGSYKIIADNNGKESLIDAVGATIYINHLRPQIIKT